MKLSRKRLFDIIQIGQREDVPSRMFDFFITVVIFTNIIAMFLETFDALASFYPLFKWLEYITLIIFCIEYALRIWTADYLYPTLEDGKARLQFLISFDGIIDLLTILPFFFLSGFIAFRMLRVVRIFHLFRLNSSYDSFNVITEVLYEKKNQIISSVFFIVILMLASSLGMYSAEHEAQPEVFANGFSGIWWSVSTVLTVGYGDIYPITTAGRILAIIIAFLGVGVVAIPTGIISAGFVEHYTQIKSSGEEKDVRFVTIYIDEKSSWYHKQVQELDLPNGLILAVIIRDGDTVIPNGDTLLEAGDKLLLGAQAYKDENSIRLQEIIIGDSHPWIDEPIRALDISRQSLIVTIRRKNRMIIPHGNTLIKRGDSVILYSKKDIKGSTDITI